MGRLLSGRNVSYLGNTTIPNYLGPKNGLCFLGVRTFLTKVQNTCTRTANCVPITLKAACSQMIKGIGWQSVQNQHCSTYPIRLLKWVKKDDLLKKYQLSKARVIISGCMQNKCKSIININNTLEKKVKSILRNLQLHHKIHSESILLPYSIHTMEIYNYYL